MLLLRKDGYIYVPVIYWLLVPFFLFAAVLTPRESTWSWLIAIALPLASLFFAVTTTIVVRRDRDDSLRVATVGRRRRVALSNAIVTVAHAHQERFRVVLDDATLTGAMLKGRCEKMAARIANHLGLDAAVESLPAEKGWTSAAILLAILTALLIAGAVAFAVS